MSRFELTILGCGSATSSFRHNPSCQVLNHNERLLMIDCGEGSQLEFRRHGLKMMRLTDIFVSHLHGDHVFGLPGLLSTMSLLGRTLPLTVHMFAAGCEALRAYLDAHSQMSFELRYHAIGASDELVFESDALLVRTFPLCHRVPCVGFVFEEKPKPRRINGAAVVEAAVPHYFIPRLREGEDYVTPSGEVIANSRLTFDAQPSVSYAYCSDTRPAPGIAEALRGVDWLYHEATYDHTLREKAHERYHSTARDAATTARDAGVRELIIGHFSKRYLDETPLLLEAQEVFPTTILAKEGLRIDFYKHLKKAGAGER